MKKNIIAKMKIKVFGIKAYLPQIKKFFRIANNILSFASSITIIISMILFCYGQVTKNNMSDNNLIFSEIMSENNNGKITSLRVEDIHGFGIDSLLVTIGNRENLSQNIENKFIIMDLTENSILHNMYDLFGFKSKYKTTFSYKLNCDIIDLHPNIEAVLDLIDDNTPTKEIVINYGVHGHSHASNFNYYAVFKYSYIESKYEIIGTYPEIKKYDLSLTNKSGDNLHIITTAQKVFTAFNDKNLNSNSINILKCDDTEKQFNLTGFFDEKQKSFWVNTIRFGKILVLVKLDIPNREALVNCYQPDYEENELSWNVIYSKSMKISNSECEQEVLDYLTKELDEQIKLIK